MALLRSKPAPPEPSIPHHGWDEFMADVFDWKQGEHVSIIGPTGTGKTTLALAILPRRRYTIVFGTKPRDATLDRLVKEQGYRKVKEWPPPAPARVMPRIVLWPKNEEIGHEVQQQQVFYDCIAAVYRVGSWCLFADEVAYLTDNLKLSRPMKTLWQQGRSLGISVVASTQRPAFVPLAMYTEATHLFFYSTHEEADLRRVAGLGGLDSDTIRRTVKSLGEHEVLYVNTRSKAIVITQVKIAA